VLGVGCSLGGEQAGGERFEPYMLRVTTVFRREDGEWRVAHRHGDSLKSRAGTGLAQLLQASDR
jgi:ketosteroid isomerase-like protein